METTKEDISIVKHINSHKEWYLNSNEYSESDYKKEIIKNYLK